MAVADDERQFLVWETTPERAGAFATKQMDVETVQLYRLKNLDKYGPGPAPMRRLIVEEKMSFHCPYCGTIIDELFYDYRRQQHLNPVFDDDHQHVYCSEDHLARAETAYQKSLH